MHCLARLLETLRTLPQSVTSTRDKARRRRLHARPRLLALECLESRLVPSADPMSGSIVMLETGEVNDQISEATPLGAMTQLRSVSGESIEVSTDVDMYSFSVTAGQKIAFDVDKPTGSGLDSYLRVFNSAGTQLAFNDDGTAPGETSSLESYLTFTFGTAGTYYVGVSNLTNSGYNPVTGSGDASGGSTGGYSLTLDVVDTDDQVSEAVALGAMTATRTSGARAIDISIDVDVYSFSVTAGQTVAFDVDRPSGSLDSYLRLFNAAGTQLASNDDGPNPAEASSFESYLTFTFGAAGTYYVGVSGYSNTGYNAVTGGADVAGSTGAYTLTLSVPDTDLDDQVSQAVALGAMTAARTSGARTIDVGTDVDLYSFSVTAGQRIAFDVDRPAGSSLDSYLRVFNAAGTQLAVNDDGPTPAEALGNESYVEVTFGTAGTFYVGVSGYGNGAYNAVSGAGDTLGSTGNYSLTLTPQAAGDTDEDDQLSEAVLLGAMSAPRSVSGSVAAGTDVDLLQFTVTAGQRVLFDLDLPTGSALDSYLRVFNSAGTQIAANDDGPTPGEATTRESYLDVTFAAAGTYYVGVSGYSNTAYNAVTGAGDASGSTGVYTLTLSLPVVTDTDDQLTEAVALGAMTTTRTTGARAIDISTDADLYSFSVTAGQTVAFDVDRPTGSALDSFLRIFNSGGTQLAANDDGAAPGESATFESYLQYTFSAAGTYYVGVSNLSNSAYNPVNGQGDVAGGSTGGYSLILTPKSAVDPDADDQINQAVALGSMTAARTSGARTIDVSTDVDLYSFSVTAGQRVAIDLDRPSGSALDSYLRIFTSAGAQLAANDDGAAPGEAASTESYLEFTFSAAGTYYVGVSNLTNSAYNPVTGGGDATGGSTGGYSLTLTPLAVGDSDPDDQIGEAVALGAMTATRTATGRAIDISTDVDVYSFSVTAGQKIAFDVDLPTGSALDSYLRVFNAAGTQLDANDDGPTPGEASSHESYLEFTFTTAGTYYVGVSGYSNSSYNPTTGTGDASGSTGGYTLTLSAATTPPQSGFHIELTFSGLSASQQAVFQQAAARWEQIILGDLPDATHNGQTVDDLLIDASGAYIDGPSNILGQAGPREFRAGSGLPSYGIMQFDTADLDAMEANGKLRDVILHEMGHVLGIGTLWSSKGLLSGAGTADPRFTGTQATAQYNAIFGRNETGVPVENTGGAGTQDSHWRETTFGDELMTGWISGTVRSLSRVTVASLADIGYTVNINAADDFTPTSSVIASPSPAPAATSASLVAMTEAAPVGGSPTGSVGLLTVPASVSGAALPGTPSTPPAGQQPTLGLTGLDVLYIAQLGKDEDAGSPSGVAVDALLAGLTADDEWALGLGGRF